jgi:hypothetical protein
VRLKVVIDSRDHVLRDKISKKLAAAADLRCEQHGNEVVSVTITVYENGWFDSCWIACCDPLAQQAARIVGSRC